MGLPQRLPGAGCDWKASCKPALGTFLSCVPPPPTSVPSMSQLMVLFNPNSYDIQSPSAANREGTRWCVLRCVWWSQEEETCGPCCQTVLYVPPRPQRGWGSGTRQMNQCGDGFGD